MILACHNIKKSFGIDEIIRQALERVELGPCPAFPPPPPLPEGVFYPDGNFFD